MHRERKGNNMTASDLPSGPISWRPLGENERQKLIQELQFAGGWMEWMQAELERLTQATQIFSHKEPTCSLLMGRTSLGKSMAISMYQERSEP